VEEADYIRAAAKKQDRTISSFVLRAVRIRLNIERQIEQREQHFFAERMRRGM
jgi:uncharacterized protein (DUF1778 family)